MTEEEVRELARSWVAEHLNDEIRELAEGETVQQRSDGQRRWEQELRAGGWLGMSWPAEHGGGGVSPAMAVVFEEELARAGAPEVLNVVGLSLVGPVLCDLGTERQRERYLSAILDGEELWCQGFSEPEAGSDLASLRTRAKRDGDRWLISGQKIWTSWAQFADRCILLARTDPDAPKHRGISAFLFDMKGPGVDVRPIRQVTGDTEFCEVFLDEAPVDAADMIGEPGDGWKVAKRTLTYERGTNFTNLAKLELTLDQTIDSVVRGNERNEADTQALVGRLISSWVEVQGLRSMGRAYLRAMHLSEDDPAESSLIKLLWSESDVRLKQLQVDALAPGSISAKDGRAGVPSDAALDLLTCLAEPIYGGSSEIQRNIIAESMLGLPRDPKPTGTGQ
jgi:alkylation response protein AidB-like acyl-CoA dehydrogenase